MGILTQAHHEHFDEYGYMVIEDAVPTDLCDAVVDAIFAFLGMDPENPNAGIDRRINLALAWSKCISINPCGTSTNIRRFIKSIPKFMEQNEFGFTLTGSI